MSLYVKNKNRKTAITSLIFALAIGMLISGWFGIRPVFAQSADTSINQISLSASLFGSDNRIITNGTYEVRFGIYPTDRTTADPYPSNADAGTRLWTETQTVTVKNGIFRASLGTVTPLPETLTFAEGDYFIGIRIGTDSEMVPRKKLGSVPSAVNSQFLQGKTIGTKQGNIPLLGKSGKLDIKNLPTGTGSKQLVLGNDARFSDIHVAATLSGTYDYLTLSGQDITLGQINLTTDVTGTLPIANGGTNATTIGGAGSIPYSTGTAYAFSAVGTADQVLISGGTGVPTWATLGGGSITPDSLDFTEFKDALTLDASTDISVTGTNVFSLTNIGTGLSLRVNDEAADTTPFVIDAAGNVGIGTTSPGAKLSIDASGANTTPLSIKTNGSAGNYTPTNSGIFVYDAAGTETLRIFASDPESISNYNAGNLYIGKQAGLSQPTDNTSAGYWNVGIGEGALYSITTGWSNTANGFQSLYSNTTGGANTAYGVRSLKFNTTGYENTAIGASSLARNTTGFYNTANGSVALYSNTTGAYNTANGSYALYYNISATSSTAIGYGAGYGNAGDYNAGELTLIGTESFYNITTGAEDNTGLGYRSGYSVTTGANNTLLGYQAGDNLTTGSNNIVLGYNIDAPAINSANTLNIGNLIFGTGIDGTGTTISTGNIGIGDTTPAALFTVGNGDLFQVNSSGAIAAAAGITSSNTITFSGLSTAGIVTNTSGGVLGTMATIGSAYITADSLDFTEFKDALTLDASTDISITGTNVFSLTNTGTGDSFLVNDETSDTTPFVIDAAGNVGIGTTTPLYKLDVAGFINTDQYSGYKQAGDTILYASTTNFSTLVGIGQPTLTSSTLYETSLGYQALGNATSSSTGYSTAIGYQALKGNAIDSSGSANTATGYQALTANSSGALNNAYGAHALTSNTTGVDNNAFGYKSLFLNSNGANNVSMGNYSLVSNTSGSLNTSLGNASLNRNVSGSNNVAVGGSALYFNTGNNNIG